MFFFSDKATNPSNRQEDWEYIMGFCDQINKELEGYGHVHSINSVSPIAVNHTHVIMLICVLTVANMWSLL